MKWITLLSLLYLALLSGIVVSCNNQSKSNVSETIEAEPVAKVEYISEIDSTQFAKLTKDQRDKVEAVRQMFVGVTDFRADSIAIQQILNTELDSIAKFKEWYFDRRKECIKE